MKKIIFILFFVVSSIAATFIACTTSNNDSSETFEIIKDHNDISTSKISNNVPPVELFEFLKIRDEIAYNVVKNNVSLTELKEAYVNKDTTKMQQLLKISDIEIYNYRKRINTLKTSMLSKYPEIKAEYEKQKDCKTCCNDIDITDVYNKLKSKGFFYMSNGTPISIMTPQKAQVTAVANETNCSWVPYTACLIVCASTGTWLYWPCAYVCMCSFCSNVPGCNNSSSSSGVIE